MACLFLDGAGFYATAEIGQKWKGVNALAAGNNSVTVGAFGRNGGRGLRFTYGQSNVALYVTAVPRVTPSGATAIMGCAFNPTGYGTGDTVTGLMSVFDGVNVQCCVRVNTSGSVSVVRGQSNGTVLGTSIATVPVGGYSYLEFKVLLHASAGTYEVRLNGTTILSGTGAQTNNAGTVVWTYGRFGQNWSGNSPSGPIWDLTDFYLCDTSGTYNTDFLGPILVVTPLVDGAGASSDFTALSGANWQNVDEALTDGDTSYNRSTVVGDHDTYTYAALGVVGTVKAVQVNVLARSAGSGGETVAPMVRIGSDNQGASQAISTTYMDYFQVYDASPATGVPWTTAEIDGAEFGAKLVS